jgi:DNA replicative helicase MCM subunit Mcm2 (Cdc46/Mcm family)/transcriptional regulator with XRE-family HTH domain
MAQSSQNQELVERFVRFYRNYYRDEIGRLAQRYPNEQRSLHVDYDDLYQFDPDLAEDYLSQPDQLGEYAEEALRVYDLPADVSLGQAHVRLRNLPDTVDIRSIRVHDNHVGRLIAVSGIIRKATDVRPKIVEAAFECQRCGTMTYIPQTEGGFQEPHECQACERQGPFRVNYDQSEFVDSQKLRVQESPEGLRGGETPQSIDVDIEDDVTGEVTAGDHVTVTGVLHIEQVTEGSEKSQLFDLYMDGVSVEIEDEQFEEMEITEADKTDIVELSNRPELYEEMIASVAPSIYGYDEEKLAMILQLFSGVTKHLPDESRIRGDLHMLLIGDPGTGKCLDGDTRVTLADGSESSIRTLVERNLDDPTPVDDGVYDEAEVNLASVTTDGTVTTRTATRVWKREAPERMYRIRTASGTVVEATPSHPLFVRDGGRLDAVRADELDVGDRVATPRTLETRGDDGLGAPAAVERLATCCTNDVAGDRIEAIETVDPGDDWVYDLEVEDTHTYLANGVVSHNSQLLSYIRNIAPRSVYTSGKGSSSAGLTAAAVRDDFGEGQQWSLEAGALVLADQGIAAVDELDKMRCVTGDTLVHLSDGSIRRIEELARDAAKIGTVEELDNGRTIRNVDLDAWSMTDDDRIVSRPVTAIHEYEAPAELTEVRLETGERLSSTADHPFFVFEDGESRERAATDLADGDWVYVPRDLPQSATDGGSVTTTCPESVTSLGENDGERVTPAFGAVLGYLSGDGNVFYDREHGSYGIRFTNAEAELLDDFERVCRAAFDAEPIRPPSERRADGVETVRLSGREYADAVLDAGMNLETYDRKAFPDGVTEASRGAKAAFVRALADSEGRVDTQTGNVRICSASYELLLGTKHLLLEFGVSSQIQRRERDDKRDLFVLAITAADSLGAFADHVGFTLDRKASALETVRANASGDRTILDVIPQCGDLLAALRTSLRLHQTACGIGGSTYCDFENGNANVSLRLARKILDAFEERKQEARNDLDELSSESSWKQIEKVTDNYHVSQAELAAELDGVTQQAISRNWGTDPSLRSAVIDRLRTVLRDVSETTLDPLRALVEGDVKWRRVADVRTVEASADDDRIDRLQHELADILDCDGQRAVGVARQLLAEEATVETWDDIRTLVDRYGLSLSTVAEDLEVDGSMLSRWTRGVVQTNRFDEVRAVVLDHVEEVRSEIRSLYDEIEDRNRARNRPRVYDLTVEGTHTFVANGMIVHNSEDRSAMHQALEQQEISISKAGINATLKSRCSLLGAANPKYGRFDQYEPIGEQIDLEPALISRFDLIFTVTDQPDAEEDAALAEHILRTNYAGELETQRTNVANPEFTAEEVASVTDTVEPAIDPDLLRKYIAYAKRTCYPTMTDEAKAAIRDFYVDLRAKGADEDAPVPVTARKLEALVRLAEASARVRLSDTVDREDADRVIDIVRSCLQDIGVDPETGEFDADVIETGTSKSQRDRIKSIKDVIEAVDAEYEGEAGAPIDAIVERAAAEGIDEEQVMDQIENLRRKGDVYNPTTDQYKVV